MPNSAKQYNEAEELALRAAGLVPKTIWVYDTDAPGFKEACRREARMLAEADAEDAAIEAFTEAALRDLAEELDRLDNEAR